AERLGSVPASDDTVEQSPTGFPSPTAGRTPPEPPAPGRPAGTPESSGMPRWLPRAMLLGFAMYGGFQLTSWAFHQVIGLLINVLIAFFGALAIEPAVDWMGARGIRRGAATGLVFVVVLAAVGLFFGLLGSLLADQLSTIVRNLPQYVNDV